MNTKTSTMIKPNFLCVGGQRCGTTWLYECLLEHPEVYMPLTKELNFFSDIEPCTMAKGEDWYFSNFKGAEGQKAIGEITPEYLVDVSAGQRIADSLGQIKIIVAVRDPLKRMSSGYKKGYRERKWDCSYQEFIENNIDYCVDRGLYFEQIQRYLDLFGSENVLVMVYEDSLSSPDSYVENVYEFLEIDSAFKPNALNSKFNISTSPVNKRVERIVSIRNQLFKIPGVESLVRVILRNPLGNKIFWSYLEGAEEKPADKKSKKPEKSEEIPESVMLAFKEDAAKLSDLVGRDMVSFWKLS